MKSRRIELSMGVKGLLGLIAIWLTFPMFIVNAQISGINYTPQQPNKAFHWYFGDQAGLDFSNGHPTAVTNGAMSSFEGTASISDVNANLLFYTNGGSMPYAGGVWNRNHQLMPNGNMATSGGCNSSFQSSLILNQPRSNDIFYLFTTDCIENNSAGGLRYSVIDMNLDGGLGDVVVKGVQLTGPTDESLTAVQHADGSDWWVITHKIHTDSFYVYHLSPQGIVGVVKSKVGNVTPDYAGALKVSTNGEKLVYAGLNWTTLFDFDVMTGEISNPVDLNTTGYSAAFSPNCQYLYVGDGIGKHIYQFNMLKSDIAGSKKLIGTTTSLGIGSVELGPDGRIYVARFTSAAYLGVIMDPNSDDTDCNYVDDGIFLDGKTSKGGLPNFPNSVMGGCTNYPVENAPSYVPNIAPQLLAMHPTAVNISWNNTGSYSYKVLVREYGTIDWTEHEVFGTETELNGLSPETKYEIRVLEDYNTSDNYEPIYDQFLDDVIARANPESNTVSKTLQVKTPAVFDFDMYPNPTSNSTQITVNTGDKVSDVNVRVVDIKGTVVFQTALTSVEGIQQYQLPVSDLSNGVYNVMVTTGSNATVKKLVVMQ